MKKMNSTTLTVAAVLLIILALLVMATPLVRTATGFTGVAGSRQFNRQGFTNPGGVTTDQGPNGQGFGLQGQNGSTGQGFGLQGQGGTTQGTPNFPNRTFTGGNRNSLLGISFLSGVTGTIVYAILLLISLAAALGMFMTKSWGKVLGIIMAIIYGLLALISFVPMILMMGLASRFGGGGNFLSGGLNIAHLVLAIAVIVLASMRVKVTPVPTDPAALPAQPA